MNLIIIDNFDSFTWNLYQQFSSCVAKLDRSDIKIQVLRNNSVQLDAIDLNNTIGIVIGPGPGRPEETGSSLKVFKKFVGKIPFLGVCLGHQLIAQYFGSTISKAILPMHGKISQLKNICGKLLDGTTSEFSVVNVARYHSLIANSKNFPASLTITSTSEDNEIMSYENLDQHLYGIQFHPESFLTECGDIIIRNFLVLALKHRGNHE